MKSLLLLLALTVPALAESKISADAHVTEALVAARKADMIRRTCPSISARPLAVWRATQDLRAYAVGQGYTEEAVKAFLRDPAEKARIAALAEAEMKAGGVDPAVVESYCVLGRAEIAAGSAAGKLLASWE
jgi:expansin (peptidoglycan-binding protein)